MPVISPLRSREKEVLPVALQIRGRSKALLGVLGLPVSADGVQEALIRLPPNVVAILRIYTGQVLSRSVDVDPAFFHTDPAAVNQFRLAAAPQDFFGLRLNRQ